MNENKKRLRLKIDIQMFAEGEEEQQQPQTEEEDIDSIINQVNELKANSVSKEEYQKLEQEKNKLLKALINGDTSGIDLENAEPKNEELLKRIKENRNKLATKEDLTNLEYAETALQLRDDVIAVYGKEKDPFLPFGHEYTLDEADMNKAENVAQAMRAAIEKADGDSTYFTNELMRNTIDVKLPKRK